LIDYTELSDLQLQQMYLSGDDDAGSQLTVRYRRMVKSCIRPYFLAGGDNEDLLQEGMIGLLSAIRNYKPEEGSSFKTFAGVCVKRRVIDAAKAASRQKHAPLNEGVSFEDLKDDPDCSTHTAPFSRSPEDQLLAQETEQDFLSTYSKYLSGFEALILSHYLNGCSYQEIAAISNSSEKSVDNAVQRIRKKLARHIAYGDISI